MLLRALKNRERVPQKKTPRHIAGYENNWAYYFSYFARSLLQAIKGTENQCFPPLSCSYLNFDRRVAKFDDECKGGNLKLIFSRPSLCDIHQDWFLICESLPHKHFFTKKWQILKPFYVSGKKILSKGINGAFSEKLNKQADYNKSELSTIYPC